MMFDHAVAEQVRQQAEGVIGQRGVDKGFLSLKSLRGAAAREAVLFEFCVYHFDIEVCDASQPSSRSPVQRLRLRIK